MNGHSAGYLPARRRYPQFDDLPHPQLHLTRAQVPIDMQAIVSGVQRYPIPQSYIPLPPGVDPAAVDFRTFFPYNPSEVKHRKRTTRSQLKVLEDTFKHETKPNATLRKTLAAQLEMTPRGVQVYFLCLLDDSQVLLSFLLFFLGFRFGFKTGAYHMPLECIKPLITLNHFRD